MHNPVESLAPRQPDRRELGRQLLHAVSHEPAQRLVWRTCRSSARAQPGDILGSLEELPYRPHLVLVMLEHERLPKRGAVRCKQHEAAMGKGP